MSVSAVLRLASTLFSALVALCFLNRPRFWWQEVVCNLALYLVPLLVLAIICNTRGIRGKRRGWAISLLGMLVGSCAMYLILSAAMPYLRYDRWVVVNPLSARRLRILFMDDCSILPPQAHEIVHSFHPDILVATGATRESAIAEGGAYPYHREFGSEQGMLVASSLPLEDRGVPTLGFNARPGGVVGVRLPSGQLIEVGVINLTPALTKSDFERNRVSARRLASYIRNSDRTRIVIGNFYATPFSQLVSVFTSQARLRSLAYGMGLMKTYDMNRWYALLSYTHGFVSRDIAPSRVERLVVPGCALAGLFAEVVVEPSSQGVSAQSAQEHSIDDNE